MKAITIYQPWASLIALGLKGFETRSWETKYRGRITIHAGKRIVMPHDNWALWNRILDFVGSDGEWKEPPLYARLDGTALSHKQFPLGAIIATADLVGCNQIVRYGGRGGASTDPGWLLIDDEPYFPTENEYLFGDWTPGRFAWKLENVQLLPEPIPAKGMQGLWNWGGE